MQRDDGFPGTGRTRHPSWTAVIALDQSTLRWMEENRPFVPGVIERALQLLYVGHHAEAALGVGMRERIGANGYGLRDFWCDARRQIQERLGSLARQVIRQFQQRILIGEADIRQPFGGDAIPQQLVLRDAGKQRWLQSRGLGDRWLLHLHVLRDDDLLHRLPNFDELRRAGLGVCFELPPFGPLIRVVVMTDIAQQQTGIGAVHDQPHIARHPNRPKPPILRLVEPVELQTRMRRVHLEIERRRLNSLLLIARESGEAIRERVGNPELHLRFSAQLPDDLRGRIKQTEPTLQWDESESLWFGKHPSNGSLKPFASAGGDAIFQLHHADDTASFEVFGKFHPALPYKPSDLFELAPGGKGGAGLDQEHAAIPRPPATILDVFEAMDNQPRPRLANDDYLHARSCGPSQRTAHLANSVLNGHQFTRNTFITSSPRWLITFTAIRPDFGFSNGREVSLFSVAQASSLTSAFSVVLSDLYGSFAPRK